MSDHGQPGQDPSDAERVGTVRRLLARELRELGDGPGAAVRLLVLGAGDGSDVLPVLAGSPATVRATLVEPDPDLAAAARGAARALRLDVDVRCADPGTTDAYLRVLPVDVLVLGGVLDDLAEADLAGAVAALPGLLDLEALVLSTSAGGSHDPVPAVREELLDGPFEELADAGPRVGAHRFTGDPEPAEPGLRLVDLS